MDSVRRSAAVTGTAVVLVPAILLIRYLAFAMLIGYRLDYRQTDGWDSWACFRAVIWVAPPKMCAEGFASPTPLQAGAAAGLSVLAGAAAAAAVVAVSGSWKDRRFEVARSVRLVTGSSLGC